MVKRIVYMILLALILSGCSYSVFANAYPHLKKIRVTAFENQTAEYELGDVLLNRMVISFRDDGRLRLATQQPDCQLEGTIKQFEERIYSFDAANNVQDYQIRINFSILFTDLIRNEVIYENRNLMLSEVYAVSEQSASRFNSREAAINEIMRNLFNIIMQNSLEKW